ncbi:MAG: 4Fe-4S dicluster domain-containing protein [Cyclobacteriaceae bacterium]|nr:(Fe-S)-binding protein [Cyclobacteriaceae bacterium]MCH8516667.1 4Fe-4S dicluster domain-containing protein [Cyclobacteriaceae bacterium]
MNYLPQIFFLLVVGVAGYILYKRINRIKKNIQMGRPEEREGGSEGFKNMLLVAFGQKKMFKKIIPATFHLFLYVGFIVINLEVLEFVIDGVAGTHRIFAPFLGSIYLVAMNIFEILAFLVVLSCVIFLWRRHVMKLERFKSREMKGWPSLDADIILMVEIVLMAAIFTMNASDQVLQGQHPKYPEVGSFWISSLFVPLFEGISVGTLVVIERVAWWFHIVGILGFAIYVTYSKHLHIFMAFPNTYFAKLKPQGHMDNMDAVTTEVKAMLGTGGDEPPAEDPGVFGAKDINDLTWKNLMDAYSCTECGRCTAECPANLTGKQLSPRKIMMDTRDRMEAVGDSLEKGGKGLEDGKSLLGDYITPEEINACTTCNACVEACPVNINPLDIILQLRRYQAMEESNAPASWNSMFSNVETSFAPWKFPPTDRFKWADSINK